MRKHEEQNPGYKPEETNEEFNELLRQIIKQKEEAYARKKAYVLDQLKSSKHKFSKEAIEIFKILIG